MKNGIILSIILLLIIIAGCTSQSVQDLKKIEIREYEGKPLSSIADFRENSIMGPQYINLDNYSLHITGLVRNQMNYSYEGVLDHQKYRKVVTLHCVEGWDATILWEGVLVSDLLKEAGLSSQANTVIFYASDGYSTSFPVDYILDKDIIMAYKMNNATIIPERGFPFQLVAESKWGYKWIKWITNIELSDNENYRGYWESRGYSNSGNLSEGFLG